jgi:rubrerythrin
MPMYAGDESYGDECTSGEDEWVAAWGCTEGTSTERCRHCTNIMPDWAEDEICPSCGQDYDGEYNSDLI